MSDSNPVWLITGASGGFGRSLVSELLRRAARVAAVARRPELIEGDESSGRLIKITCDVTKENSTQEAVGRVEHHCGRYDVLLNDAGYGRLGALEELSARPDKVLPSSACPFTPLGK